MCNFLKEKKNNKTKPYFQARKNNLKILPKHKHRNQYKQIKDFQAMLFWVNRYK